MELRDELNALRSDVEKLKAESEARRVLARYLYICDVPVPEYAMSLDGRIQAITELFTEDAIWEGVGGIHGQQFGRHHGPQGIGAHMRRFYSATDPKQVFNVHYLCTEQVTATEEGAEGIWVQFQPWINDRGESILRSSRLHVRFRNTDLGWKICRYRTESLFVAKLPDNWTSTRIETAQLMAKIED